MWDPLSENKQTGKKLLSAAHTAHMNGWGSDNGDGSHGQNLMSAAKQHVIATSMGKNSKDHMQSASMHANFANKHRGTPRGVMHNAMERAHTESAKNTNYTNKSLYLSVMDTGLYLDLSKSVTPLFLKVNK